MAKIDHSRRNARDRMARQGSDSVVDFGLPAGMTPPKPRKSKASLRAEASEAVASITRLVRCPCGHSGKVAVTPAMTGRRFRCSKCGEAIE
ncbi:MAG: hypothetical protein O9256_01930 [Rhizobiaceae bacterium]|nr:hypothetical protein [Rhizobiaceae bacterium]MCZ8349841.1 hypothetical protein [Rhizobium sp.]